MSLHLQNMKTVLDQKTGSYKNVKRAYKAWKIEKKAFKQKPSSVCS